MNRTQKYWIFQAVPRQFDINQYLMTTDDYIYWRAKQRPSDMTIGDIVFFWRGQSNGFATGIIAKGIIEELPARSSHIIHPEKLSDHLWKTDVNKDDLLAGIRLSEIRLTEDDGMIAIDILKKDPVMMNHRIVVSPRQTNFPLSPNEYARILELWNQDASQFNTIIHDVNSEYINDVHEDAIQGRTDIDGTQKKQFRNARRGQGVFRNNVIRNERKCRVTGVSDMRFLIASHIKPWVTSSDVDKLHGANGLLLAPHVDRLFDRGMISFSNDGKILVSKYLDRNILDAWSIDPNKNVGKFKPSQIKFLEYHRNHIFDKKHTT